MPSHVLRRLLLIAILWSLTTGGATVSCSSDPGNLLPPENRPPVAADADFQVVAGASLTALLAATDPDGDALSFRIVTGPAPGALTAFDGALGRFTFLPGGVGSDSFSFVASDGRLESAAATVRITVVGGAAKPAQAPAAGGGWWLTRADDPYVQGRQLAVSGVEDGLAVLEGWGAAPDAWSPLGRFRYAAEAAVLSFDPDVPGRVGLGIQDGAGLRMAVSADGGRSWPLWLELGAGLLDGACPPGRVCQRRGAARYAWPLPGW